MAISRSCHLCTGDLLTTDVILLVHPQGDYPTLLVVLDPTSLLGRSSPLFVLSSALLNRYTATLTDNRSSMGSRFQSRSAHMADLKGKRICYEDDEAPIHKILNPKKQNVEKLIQAMPHQWGLEDRITANDLGNGKFLKIQSPEGEEVTIEIKYDMLFKHCTTCGALSHEKGFCSTNSVSSQTQGQHQGRTGVFARVQLPYQSSRQPLLGEKGASDYHSRSAYMARHADNRRGYDDREGLRDSYHVNRSHHEGATFHAWSRDGANQYSHSDRIMRRRDGNGRTHSYGGSRQYSKPYHRNVEQRWCAKQYNGSYNMRREEPERGSQATIIPDGSDINGNSGNDQHVAQHSEDDGKDARHGNKLASEIVTPTSPHSLHMSDNCVSLPTNT
ncbi:hypothetical protein YC2023_060369 [Brassica napus]